MPPNAPPKTPAADQGMRPSHDNRLLEADVAAKEKLNRETDQRYLLRWAAVTITIALIIGMTALLWSNHFDLRSSSNTYAKLPTAYLVAAYVAPIASVSVLAMALLVAAFRGYSRTDEDAPASAASDAAREAARESMREQTPL